MNQYYIVWVGRVPGVYESWEQCQEQVSGYPSARFKKVKASSRKDAESVLNNSGETSNIKINNQEIDQTFLSVDGASNGDFCEFRAVWVGSKEVAFSSKKFELGTNNIAEFLGLVFACKYLMDKGLPLNIYTDSVTAMSWFKNKKANTTASSTGKLTPELENWVSKAELFLFKNNEIMKNAKILKWDTKNWGEIPADFGRK